MSQTPSTFKVFALVLLATLLGGLLFAQVQSPGDAAAPASPSDKPTVAEEVVAEKTPEVAAEAEVQAVKELEVASEPVPTTVATAEPVEADGPSQADIKAAWQPVLVGLTIFVLAIFVGFEVITKVPQTLHTPLMSGSNAISGITLVGAVIVAASMSFSGFVGLIAVALATVNAVGGFMVTHRMLAMFKKR